ncbi:MAG TPA: class I SAM-dependent methyltransferase [Solirubrobacteraceae bacterium]|nr:class I SAM-dependent methyltransferase [Solirubrobacteraceae bacterium]
MLDKAVAEAAAKQDRWLVRALDRAATRVLGRLLPQRMQLRAIGPLRALLYRGDRVECPCCGGRFRHFLPYWNRLDCVCPRCFSHERHRALWLYLRERTDLFERDGTLLHFAPEEVFARRFAAQPNLRYVSADLAHPLAIEHFDITRIPHPDESFDFILCNHVLNEVPDDRRAMRELERVLRPEGWAIVMVPLDHDRAETLEDPAITTPEQRREAYLEPGNLRRYGRDFAGRLRDAGWTVRVDRYVSELDATAIARYGLLPIDDVFFCTKS